MKQLYLSIFFALSMYKFLALWHTGHWVLPVGFLLYFHIRLYFLTRKKLWYIKYSSRLELTHIGLINDWASHIDRTAAYSRADPMWRSKGRMLDLSEDIQTSCTVPGLCRKKEYERAVFNVLLFCSWYLPSSGISTRLMLSEARDGQD